MNVRVIILVLATAAAVAGCERVVELRPGPDASPVLPDAPTLPDAAFDFDAHAGVDAAPDAGTDAAPADASID